MMVNEEHMNPPMKKDANPGKIVNFFGRHPDIKAKIVDYLKDFPKDQRQKSLEEFYRYINGEMTWAEIRKISRRLQKEVARVAYLKFKMREYDSAETLFKGLAVIDHRNWYYRAAMAAIYQRQRKYEQAIEEYTTALQLKPDEVTALVNRGECRAILKDFAGAMADFDRMLALPLPEGNPWVARTKVLKGRVELLKQRV